MGLLGASDEAEDSVRGTLMLGDTELRHLTVHLSDHMAMEETSEKDIQDSEGILIALQDVIGVLEEVLQDTVADEVGPEVQVCQGVLPIAAAITAQIPPAAVLQSIHPDTVILHGQ